MEELNAELKRLIDLEVGLDKDVISVIISFFVGVGSIIVGCVTISVSNQQVILTNRQVELQELLEQPIFRIEYDFVDTYDDEVTYYDTKVINVYNLNR